MMGKGLKAPGRGAEPLEVVEGQVLLPQRPGIGLSLNRKAMERFRV